MSGDPREYVRYRLGRAHEAIDVAQDLLAGGHLPDVVSKLYYACFYAATAALASEGVMVSRHSTATSQFHARWVKSGRFPRAAGGFLSDMLRRRLHSDYAEVVSFEHSEVESWLAETKAFVEQIEAYLRQQAGDS